ncbi:MAG TPA: ATP-dependent DNA helicase RecG, partial [Patescibacteria group bacterium]|nr:ATP-dependent DNA helicase RecG [Patescibacteria group bacterium]
FNQTYIAKQLKAGDEIILSGKVGRYKTLQLTNPAYELLREDAELNNSGVPINLHTGRLVPIYKRSDLIPLRTMRRLVKLCLPAASELEDFVPKSAQKKEKLLPIEEAVRFLHFPENDEQITEARYRIAVDDVLPQQLAVQMLKNALDESQGFAIHTDIEKVKLFLKTLPFTLTDSQKRATWDIFKDIESGKPMNRLLQGDVGSGKTIVAILASLQTAGAGLQTALLAPTEILAKQHYETFGEILGSSSGIALLTRTFAIADGKEVSKAELLKLISKGKVQICIGTHALLQDKIEFKNLAFVIIDEQHRFGVGQRGWLFKMVGGKQSATKQQQAPHLLSMSATPIPRTLAMSMYADLAVSTLSQVPSGRKPVKTEVVPEEKRQQAYDFIRREAGDGRQAFIVTPRVEESETSEVRSVKKEFARLQTEVFPDLKLGLLYGKMKGADKDKVMAEFAAGKLDILVTTSVIEIGIDIPKATSMIIEGSERFGLAQLHQLRGRVGRNNFDCYCFLFTTESSQADNHRLSALSKTNDGFVLAELDLKQRGFGDLFGK